MAQNWRVIWICAISISCFIDGVAHHQPILRAVYEIMCEICRGKSNKNARDRDGIRHYSKSDIFIHGRRSGIIIYPTYDYILFTFKFLLQIQMREPQFEIFTCESSEFI